MTARLPEGDRSKLSASLAIATIAWIVAQVLKMLLHFAAEWCSACKRMAVETFGDPRVKTQAGRFVAVLAGE